MTLPRIKFNPEFNWGHIFMILGMAFTGFLTYQAITRAIDNHEYRIVQLERGVQNSQFVVDGFNSLKDKTATLETLILRSNDRQIKLIEQVSDMKTDIAVMKTQMNDLVAKSKRQ